MIITENILPALLREHSYEEPNYPQTTLPYITPLKYPSVIEEKEDTSETIGSCPSKLYQFISTKISSSHKKLQSENVLQILAMKIKYR